jgi:preprotein translocase subunit Sss1
MIATATGMGLVCLGLLGFFIKLIHIPVNQILVG